MLPTLPAMAEETTEKYPYTLFAGSSEEGAITVNAGNFCVNGNVATNGTIVSSGNMNINGTKTENANVEMIYIPKKLDYAYFIGDNVDFYSDDYSYEEMNININIPMDVHGELELTGNINLNTGIKALEDVNLNGEVKNTNNSVICSETGDIVIDSTNVNLNGLVYAPYGDVEITAQNLNLNNVIIIADTITFNCPSVNANYSSSMAELMGTESDIIVKLYAFGAYNTEVGTIIIEWNSNYKDSIYEIWVSDDNIEYNSVSLVSDSTTYAYTITEEFEKKYFKVSLETNYGEIAESIPFVVNKSDYGYIASLIDSDSDGLVDVYEDKIGTDANEPDTDSDTLTDLQELFFVGTDPTIFDSVTEGLSDADADSDGDGISNIHELEFAINPQNSDTDDDKLSDYDEIYNCETDPINPDTDNDTIIDGDELKIELDPKNPETFGIPDAEYKIAQIVSADDAVLSDINTAENPYKLSIDITAAGYVSSNLTADISSYTDALSGNTAIVGTIAALNYSSDTYENITLRFEMNADYLSSMGESSVEGLELKGINRLHVFRYDEENNVLYPVETIINNNTVTVNTNELGTYCLVDLNNWLEAIDIDFSNEEVAPVDIQLFNFEIEAGDESISLPNDECEIVNETVPENYEAIVAEQIDEVINNIEQETATERVPEVAMFSTYSSVSTYSARNEIDLVFVIDTSGSMSSAISTAKSSMSNLVDYLHGDGIDVNIAVVSYSDYGCDGINGAKTYSINGSHWATTPSEATQLINQVKLYGCGHETPLDGLEMAHQLDFHRNTTKFMVLITDESYSYSNNRYGISSIQDLADDLKDDEIYTSVVCYDSHASGYAPLNNTTNGIQINIAMDWPMFLEHYIRTYIKEMKTFITVVPHSLEVISLKEVPEYGALVNSDEDELWDYEEINWSYIDTTSDELVLPTLSEYLINIHGENALETLPLAQEKLDRINALVILPVTSNPEISDSDGDNLSDSDESNLDINAFNADSDGDKLNDDIEVKLWFNPNEPNIDGDSFNDYDEWLNDTDPYVYNMNATESAIAFAEGTALGDFATADNIETLLGQISFSFVPFVADARDYFANVFVNLDTLAALANLGGFILDIIPGVGTAGDVAKALPKLGRFVAKYADDAPKVMEAIIKASKSFPASDEVIPALVKILPAGTVDNIIKSVKNGECFTEANYARLINVCESAGKNADEIVNVTKFKNFRALKASLGDPGANKQWHHIVEQCQVKSTRSGFNVGDINNVTNIKATPNDVHKKICAYYSSKQEFTNGRTVRDWLNGQSYEKQFEFGLEKWEDFMKEFGYAIE